MATRYATFKCTYKNTHISAATHPRMLNLVPNQSLDQLYLLVGYANYFISIFMNTNENNRNKRKMVEKLGMYYKITNISSASYSRVPKLVLYQF